MSDSNTTTGGGINEQPRMFLSRGAHPAGLSSGSCAMELAAYLAGEPHTDQPKAVSPLICDVMRITNDALNDVERQQLLPYCIRVIGTRTTAADEDRRAKLVLEWIVAERHVPLHAVLQGGTWVMAARSALTRFATLMPGESLIRYGIFKLLDDLIAVGDRTVVECDVPAAPAVVPERVEVYRATLAGSGAEGR